MAKDSKLKITVEVDDNGSRKVRKLGDNIDETARKGTDGFDDMDKSLGDFNVTAGKAVGVIGGIATGLAAAGTAVSVFVVQTAKSHKELKNLSDLAGLSQAELTNLGYATDTVGINMEKLADISKDVKDKIGDFIATGGGEFKDFFEEVAPQVGLTAESLKHLSGPEILVAVKKAMDDANVSAIEQVFYMEAIANDASKLIPLLEDEAAALREKAAEAEKLGVAISEIDSQNLLDAAAASTKFSNAFEGLYNRVAARMGPALTTAMNYLAEAIGEVNENLDYRGSKLGELERELHLMEQLGGSGRRMSEEGKTRISELRNEITYLRDIEELKRNATYHGSGAGLPAPSPDASGSTGTKSDPKKTKGTVRPVTIRADKEKILRGDDVLQAYELAASRMETINQRTYETLLAGYQADRDAFIELTGDKEAAMQVYFNQVDRLNEKAGLSFEDVSEDAKEMNSELENAVTGWASGFSGTLADMVWEADASFGSIVESFGRMITQMVIQQQIVQPLLNSAFGEGGFFTTNAHGNVYPANSKGISAYSNTITNQPTFFQFAQGAGVFGEAGWEGIFPLTRGPDGDLGVKATGTDSNPPQPMIVNIYEAEGTKATVQQSDDGMSMDVIITQLEGAMNKRISRGKGQLAWLGSTQRRGG